MSFRYNFIVIILIGENFPVIAQNSTTELCGIQSKENPYPWLVGIEFKTEEDQFNILQCTGALISRRHVLSKAFCFDDLFNGQPRKSVYSGSNVTIAVGKCAAGSLNFHCLYTGDINIPVKTVILHPDYIGTTWISADTNFYDIALMILREKIPYTNFVRPICLPSSDVTQLAEIDRMLYAAGLNGISPSLKLNGNITYLDQTGCTSIFPAKDEICATDTNSLCLINGGLVMKKKEDRYELVGFSGARCDNYKVFTNLFIHLDWIRNYMNESFSGEGCGRRKVDHTELIFNGEATKIGYWPWHVAIFRMRIYICGGTLISKTMILTAAHCVTINGEPVNPQILTVFLGKYNLLGNDLESQEKEVQQVISHERFAPLKHFENDIALLKLKTEATYNTNVQPACVWSGEAKDRFPVGRNYGTVVGWGTSEVEKISSQLKAATFPKVSDITCIRKNPLFYTTVLENDKKFCAGWANGTSPCNGDSGGGFVVFVPDTAKDHSADAIGSWYIRGIVSLTAIIRNLGRCDPSQYVVFTDVDKYTGWIQTHLLI